MDNFQLNFQTFSGSSQDPLETVILRRLRKSPRYRLAQFRATSNVESWPLILQENHVLPEVPKHARVCAGASAQIQSIMMVDRTCQTIAQTAWHPNVPILPASKSRRNSSMLNIWDGHRRTPTNRIVRTTVGKNAAQEKQNKETNVSQ